MPVFITFPFWIMVSNLQCLYFLWSAPNYHAHLLAIEIALSFPFCENPVYDSVVAVPIQTSLSVFPYPLLVPCIASCDLFLACTWFILPTSVHLLLKSAFLMFLIMDLVICPVQSLFDEFIIQVRILCKHLDNLLGIPWCQSSSAFPSESWCPSCSAHTSCGVP